MTITFYWNYLNHHQVLLADEMFKLLGDNFTFVVTLPHNEFELKGGIDYSSRPYCVMATESAEAQEKAIRLCRTTDVCVFGACSQKYAVERAKQKDCGLSFEFGERWLKRRIFNVLSPRFLRWWLNYMHYYRHKPFYKLCASAYAAKDDYSYGCYRDRHFKWGYFTEVPKGQPIEPYREDKEYNRIIWCSRFIKWKHPELPVLLAEHLKSRGYDFHLEMYGTGELETRTKALAIKKGVSDLVLFNGSIPNAALREAMRNADIFLFTSDRQEGWGAVANESMSEGCVLVGSNEIGSMPYLVEDGISGLVFKAPKMSSGFLNPDKSSLESLSEKVTWLLDNPERMREIQVEAQKRMRQLWNPENAAKSLLKLIEDLSEGRHSSIVDGPGSIA